MKSEERREKIMLANLLWRLKVSFSEYDGTEVTISRLKSDIEYLSVILKRAITQNKDFLVKQLAFDVIRVLHRNGKVEEKEAIENILASYKIDAARISYSASEIENEILSQTGSNKSVNIFASPVLVSITVFFVGLSIYVLSGQQYL